MKASRLAGAAVAECAVPHRRARTPPHCHSDCRQDRPRDFSKAHLRFKAFRRDPHRPVRTRPLQEYTPSTVWHGRMPRAPSVTVRPTPRNACLSAPSQAPRRQSRPRLHPDLADREPSIFAMLPHEEPPAARTRLRIREKDPSFSHRRVAPGEPECV